MHTIKSACAFPSESEYPARFPIAAILPYTIDVYEPLLDTWDSDLLKNLRNMREKASKSYEQIAVLVSMAQYQAKVLDIRRFKIKDSRLDVFEVPCLSRKL
jgi:hypothetical protein